MDYKPLVEAYRGGTLENVHHGVICGVSDRGEVIYSVGDENHLTFLRSAAKPLQAIPAITHGVDKKFALSAREAALFAASHRGETYHIEALDRMAQKMGIDEAELHCLPTYPLNDEPKAACIYNHLPKRRMYHNCSGKHLGMIGLCKLLGYSVDGYWEQEHPVQKKILQVLAAMADFPQQSIKQGIDGCGVPVFALPLKHLALAYMKMACPDLIADEAMRSAVQRIVSLMNDHPEMIASWGFTCTALLLDDNIVAKGGAQGVYCFGLKRERLSFALKVLDGSETVWPLILATMLEQIGYSNRETIDRLHELLPRDIRNDNGRIVGEYKAVFTL
ncbi:asparaginase [Numidum massiliense]|uniref:asparaginase n=1 Tax=Numidum massiliense TaxID=1522315 RepID=UPI0006D5A297|nr:asparaginase [Numidum massiliense]